MKLHTLPRKIAFAIAGAALAGFYCAGAIRQYHAYRLSRSPESKRLERAIGLDPDNADYRSRLGRFLFFSQQDESAAVENLRAAARLNPYVARYWMDLALAYRFRGDLEGEQQAIERALRAEPTTPDVAWQAANLYVVRGSLEKALPQLRIVIQNQTSLISPAINLGWRATGHDVKRMLDEVLPPVADAYLALLALLMEEKETAAAAAVWERLVRLQLPFPPASAFPYLDYLIAQRRPADAFEAWKALLALNPALPAYLEPAGGNLVVNGGFDEDVLNGGFDWRIRNLPDVKLEMDSGVFHSGRRALAVSFLGLPVPDAGVFQYVVVKPNTSYRLSGFLKAENLESASGPRLVLEDPYNSQVYASSDEVLGSTTWKALSADFRTGPETQVLVLKIARLPSEPLIKGSLRVDDVSIVEMIR